MSFNPLHDFDSSEWVVSSLAPTSSSLLSSTSSASQDNWTSTFDPNLDSSFLFSDQQFSNNSSAFSSDTSSPFMAMASDIHSVPASLGHVSSSSDSAAAYHTISNTEHFTISQHNLSDLWSADTVPSSHVSDSSSPSLGSESQTVRPPPSTSSSSSRKRSATPVNPTDDRAEKRRRNNIAAAKYRQKKVDRIEELEGQLQAVMAERDDLKIALAKRDAEVELLRAMLERKN